MLSFAIFLLLMCLANASVEQNHIKEFSRAEAFEFAVELAKEMAKKNTISWMSKLLGLEFGIHPTIEDDDNNQSSSANREIFNELLEDTIGRTTDSTTRDIIWALLSGENTKSSLENVEEMILTTSNEAEGQQLALCAGSLDRTFGDNDIFTLEISAINEEFGQSNFKILHSLREACNGQTSYCKYVDRLIEFLFAPDPDNPSEKDAQKVLVKRAAEAPLVALFFRHPQIGVYAAPWMEEILDSGHNVNVRLANYKKLQFKSLNSIGLKFWGHWIRQRNLTIGLDLEVPLNSFKQYYKMCPMKFTEDLKHQQSKDQNELQELQRILSQQRSMIEDLEHENTNLKDKNVNLTRSFENCQELGEKCEDRNVHLEEEIRKQTKELKSLELFRRRTSESEQMADDLKKQLREKENELQKLSTRNELDVKTLMRLPIDMLTIVNPEVDVNALKTWNEQSIIKELTTSLSKRIVEAENKVQRAEEEKFAIEQKEIENGRNHCRIELEAHRETKLYLEQFLQELIGYNKQENLNDGLRILKRVFERQAYELSQCQLKAQDATDKINDLDSKLQECERKSIKNLELSSSKGLSLFDQLQEQKQDKSPSTEKIVLLPIMNRARHLKRITARSIADYSGGIQLSQRLHTIRLSKIRRVCQRGFISRLLDNKVVYHTKMMRFASEANLEEHQKKTKELATLVGALGTSDISVLIETTKSAMIKECDTEETLLDCLTNSKKLASVAFQGKKNIKEKLQSLIASHGEEKNQLHSIIRLITSTRKNIRQSGHQCTPNVDGGIELRLLNVISNYRKQLGTRHCPTALRRQKSFVASVFNLPAGLAKNLLDFKNIAVDLPTLTSNIRDLRSFKSNKLTIPALSNSSPIKFLKPHRRMTYLEKLEPFYQRHLVFDSIKPLRRPSRPSHRWNGLSCSPKGNIHGLSRALETSTPVALPFISVRKRQSQKEIALQDRICKGKVEELLSIRNIFEEKFQADLSQILKAVRPLHRTFRSKAQHCRQNIPRIIKQITSMPINWIPSCPCKLTILRRPSVPTKQALGGGSLMNLVGKLSTSHEHAKLSRSPRRPIQVLYKAMSPTLRRPSLIGSKPTHHSHLIMRNVRRLRSVKAMIPSLDDCSMAKTQNIKLTALLVDKTLNGEDVELVELRKKKLCPNENLMQCIENLKMVNDTLSSNETEWKSKLEELLKQNHQRKELIDELSVLYSRNRRPSEITNKYSHQDDLIRAFEAIAIKEIAKQTSNIPAQLIPQLQGDDSVNLAQIIQFTLYQHRKSKSILPNPSNLPMLHIKTATNKASKPVNARKFIIEPSIKEYNLRRILRPRIFHQGADRPSMITIQHMQTENSRLHRFISALERKLQRNEYSPLGNLSTRTSTSVSIPEEASQTITLKPPIATLINRAHRLKHYKFFNLTDSFTTKRLFSPPSKHAAALLQTPHALKPTKITDRRRIHQPIREIRQIANISASAAVSTTRCESAIAKWKNANDTSGIIEEQCFREISVEMLKRANPIQIANIHVNDWDKEKLQAVNPDLILYIQFKYWTREAKACQNMTDSQRKVLDHWPQIRRMFDSICHT